MKPDEDRFLLCQTRHLRPDIQFQAILAGRVAVLRCKVLPHFQTGWLSEVGELADGRLVRGTVAVQPLQGIRDMSKRIRTVTIVLSYHACISWEMLLAYPFGSVVYCPWKRDIPLRSSESKLSDGGFCVLDTQKLRHIGSIRSLVADNQAAGGVDWRCRRDECCEKEGQDRCSRRNRYDESMHSGGCSSSTAKE